MLASNIIDNNNNCNNNNINLFDFLFYSQRARRRRWRWRRLRRFLRFASRFAHNTDSTSTSTSYAFRRQIHTVNHAHARLHAAAAAATVCSIVHTRTHTETGTHTHRDAHSLTRDTGRQRWRRNNCAIKKGWYEAETHKLPAVRVRWLYNTQFSSGELCAASAPLSLYAFAGRQCLCNVCVCVAANCCGRAQARSLVVQNGAQAQ